MALTEQLASYDWGKVINFGTRGNGSAFCKSGWGEAEEGLVWTNSHNARMTMNVRPPGSDITLFLECMPFVAKGAIEEQELHLYINFLRVDFVTIAEPAEIEIHVPKHVMERPRCVIDFYTPAARSPFNLGLGADIRCLGIAISRLIMVQR